MLQLTFDKHFISSTLDGLIPDLVQVVTPRMSQRHFMWNILSFLRSFCVIVQVSVQYNSTDKSSKHPHLSSLAHTHTHARTRTRLHVCSHVLRSLVGEVRSI